MEGRRNWLGYAAVGIGLLALVIALSDRAGGIGSYAGLSWGQVGPAPFRYAAPAAPQPPQAPQAQPAPEWGPGQERREFRFKQWHHDELRPAPGVPFAHGVPHGPPHVEFFERGHGPFFFGGPFMFLRGLRDLLIAGILILLGLRLLRGRPTPPQAPPTEPPLA